MMAAKQQSLHYKVVGDGPVLVLLHGFLESMEMWSDLVRGLESSYRMVLIDLPGHGNSPSFGAPCSMATMAQAVFEVLEAEQIERAHFIGHSMGGYVLLELLESHGSVFQSIMLINSTTLADTSRRIMGREQALRLLEEDSKRYVRFAVKGLFPAEDQLRFNSQIETLVQQAHAFPKEGLKGAIQGMLGRKDHTQTLKSFAGPKWAIYGERDPLIPSEVNKDWTSRAQTQTKSYDTGHMIWLELPQELTKIVHFIE